MQLRFLCLCTVFFALCSYTSALLAQDLAPANSTQPSAASQRAASETSRLQLDPKLVVATPTSGCVVDAERLVARLRLEARQDALREPPLKLAWYRGPLVAAYMGPPVGFAVTALALDQEAIAMPILASLLGLALPPIVHAANSNSAGAWYSILGVLGSVAAGSLLGTAAAALAPGPQPQVEDPAMAATMRRESREQNALMFAFVSYAIWTLIDVAFFANVDESKVLIPK